MKNTKCKFHFAPPLYKCIVILCVAMAALALASCAPIPTGGGYYSGGGDAVGSGGDSSGSGGGGGGNGASITISLPALSRASIRALTDEQVSRLQSETAKYRVTFSGAGQMITREGTGTIYSATFPVGTQVGVTVYCVNAAGQDIVKTTTKTITVSSGANSLSFKISADGTELEHVPDDTTPTPTPDPTPTPQPTPGIQYVTVRFHQGWVRSSAAGTAVTWGAMTGAVLPTDGRRVYGSSTSADQASAQGYVFIGWTADSTQPTGTVQFREYYSPGPDDVSLDLYGIWEVRESENHYRVIFNSGNTPGSTVSNLPQNFQQEKGTQATIPTSPNNPLSCPGYVFKGWDASPSVSWASQSSNEFTMPSSDVTLTAQWELITYTIRYASSGQLSDLKNGASFDVANGGSTVTLLGANTFTKKGYTLAWWTSPNSQFSVYQPGDNSVSKIGIIECADGASNDPTKVTITLVADWEPIEYTINVANNGATILEDAVTGTYTIDNDISLSGVLADGKIFNYFSFTANNPQQIRSSNPLYGTFIIPMEEVITNYSNYISRDNVITLYPIWKATAASVTEGGTEEFYDTFDAAWNAMKNAANLNNPIVVKMYEDATVASTLQLEGADVTLDLNGFTLDGSGTDSNSVLEIVSTSSSTILTLTDTSSSGDGQIIGASAPAIKVGGKNGTTQEFNMTGGKITDANNSGNGGGVYVSENGTFNMEGGTITGNTASDGGGVCVDGGGTFNMSGGTITGNTASGNGGGVYVATGSTFNISGNVQITSNQKNGNAASNVYLAGTGSVMITLTGTLDAGSSIGVTLETPPGIFTNGWSTYKGSADTSVFKSDETGRTVTESGDELTLQSK